MHVPKLFRLIPGELDVFYMQVPERKLKTPNHGLFQNLYTISIFFRSRTFPVGIGRAPLGAEPSVAGAAPRLATEIFSGSAGFWLGRTPLVGVGVGVGSVDDVVDVVVVQRLWISLRVRRSRTKSRPISDSMRRRLDSDWLSGGQSETGVGGKLLGPLPPPPRPPLLPLLNKWLNLITFPTKLWKCSSFDILVLC